MISLSSALPRPDLPVDLGFPPQSPGAGLRITFMGTVCLLITNGSDAILVDGFFSRPGVVRTVTSRLRPNIAVIRSALQRINADRVRALVISHSHYDHAMDALPIVRQTGAKLVGSSSTAMIGRGGSVPEDRILVPGPHRPVALGSLTVTLIPSAHVPPARFPGSIEAPLRMPARLADYKVGDCYSIHVQDGDRGVLINSSAGSVAGAVSQHPAGVVYLGVGALGVRPVEYLEKYWQQVVVASGARRVVLVHWDNYMRPLDAPLVPLPYGFDNLTRTLTWLRAKCGASGVDMRLPRVWETVDPFHGL